MITPELSASKVAGFIGLHKYQSPIELYYELLLKDKDARAVVLALETATGRRSFTGLLNEVLKEQPVKDCIYTGIADANKTQNVGGVLEEVEAQARVILDLRRDALPRDVREKLVAEIRGKISKGRGIQNENAILDQYEVARDVKGGGALVALSVDTAIPAETLEEIEHAIEASAARAVDLS